MNECYPKVNYRGKHFKIFWKNRFNDNSIQKPFAHISIIPDSFEGRSKEEEMTVGSNNGLFDTILAALLFYCCPLKIKTYK